jgi:multidrug resistance efflux pump
MRVLFIMLIISNLLHASEYYAKAEPVDTFILKSAVSGQVIKVEEHREGRVAGGGYIIMIDDKVNRLELHTSKEKLQFLESNIKLTEQAVQNSYKAMKIAKANYERVKNLSSYSKVQKDNKLLSAITSTNSYIQSKSSLETLKTQRADLKLRIETLEDTISKKNISVTKGLYIYKIYPKVGDFVTMGAPLIEMADISKARLTIFVTKEDLEGIEDKKIYIDAKETPYRIDKLWQIADSKNISAYKTEIIIDKPKHFSTLMKVEFR